MLDKEADTDAYIDGNNGFISSILNFPPGKAHLGDRWEPFVLLTATVVIAFALFTVFSIHVAVFLLISCGAGLYVFYSSSNPTAGLMVTLGSILFLGTFLMYYRYTHSLALDSTVAPARGGLIDDRWGVTEVQHWLRENDLGIQQSMFAIHNIDGKRMLSFPEDAWANPPLLINVRDVPLIADGVERGKQLNRERRAYGVRTEKIPEFERPRHTLAKLSRSVVPNP